MDHEEEFKEIISQLSTVEIEYLMYMEFGETPLQYSFEIDSIFHNEVRRALEELYPMHHIGRYNDDKRDDVILVYEYNTKGEEFFHYMKNLHKSISAL